MKKIAVMTWYLYRNYGTVLQAVALNRTIRNLGYDASTIAYDPPKGKNLLSIELLVRLNVLCVNLVFPHLKEIQNLILLLKKI